MSRVLVGYDECKCILTQYCDGECRPVFADRSSRYGVAPTQGADACTNCGMAIDPKCACSRGRALADDAPDSAA